MTDDDDTLDVPRCVYCDDPIARHGITTTGCELCGCGFDGDWHPEPGRPEPWGNA